MARVSFMAKGRRVAFNTKSKPKRRAPMRRKTSRVYSRRNTKIRRDTERFVENISALAHPAAPAVISGVRLLKDILKR